MTRIIVDSTCDLSQEYLDQYGIPVMPLRVLLDGVEYRDRMDIQIGDVYARMRQGVLPKTSQIAPADLYETFSACAGRGEDLIYIAFSAAMSGTCNLAAAVVEELRQEYPDRRMEVVDSMGGCLATGLIALQAARLAAAGQPYDRLLEQIRYLIEHVQHVFAVADLNWLVKGGRVNKIVGRTGSMLDIRPILDVEEGRMKVIGFARGARKTFANIAELVAKRIAAFPEQIVGIAHADDPTQAYQMKELLERTTACKNFMIERIGCVLGAHLGISGVGVFFFDARPDFYIFQ